VAKVTITLTSTCGTAFIHQPTLIQFSVGDTFIPPEPLRFPNDDAPNRKGEKPPLPETKSQRRNRENKERRERQRAEKERRRRENETPAQRGRREAKERRKAEAQRRKAEAQRRREEAEKRKKMADPSPKVNVGEIAEAVRKALAESESVTNVDGSVGVVTTSTQGSAAIFSFSFEATGEVDIGVTGESGSTQLDVSVEVDGLAEDEVFRVKILRDADVRSAHRNHAWTGTPDDHNHSTKTFGGKGRPRRTKVPIQVCHRVGSLAPGFGACIELAPAFGGGLTLELASGPDRGQFREASPLGAGAILTERYFADGFYYPRDLATGATSDDVSLQSVGFAPGRALTGRGDGPRSVEAMRRVHFAELEPVDLDYPLDDPREADRFELHEDEPGTVEPPLAVDLISPDQPRGELLGPEAHEPTQERARRAEGPSESTGLEYD